MHNSRKAMHNASWQSNRKNGTITFTLSEPELFSINVDITVIIIPRSFYRIANSSFRRNWQNSTRRNLLWAYTSIQCLPIMSRGF